MTVEGQHRAQRVASRVATGSRVRRGRPLSAAEIAALAQAEGDIDRWYGGTSIGPAIVSRQAGLRAPCPGAPGLVPFDGFGVLRAIPIQVMPPATINPFG